MSQVKAPGDEQVGSVLSFLHARTEKFGNRVALCVKDGDGWRELTYEQLSEKAVKLASYLIELGISQGDRIAILSESKPEWGVAFFSGVRSGAVIVPLDIKLTESELNNIMSDCAPRVVLCDLKHKETIFNVKKSVKSIEHVFIVDEGKGDAEAPSIDTLTPKAIQQGRERKLDEVALLVYTSGTTGNPKGVMTTYGNLIFQVSSFESMVDLSESDRFLSILPLNHLLELTGGFLGLLNSGGSVNFCHSLFPQEVIKLMREKEITGMIGVPLFFKSLKGGIEREIRKAGEDAVSRFKDGLAAAAKLPFAERAKLFAPVHQQLGGKLRVFICGGAPLEMEVAEFFDAMGIHILQGYGLTETSPVISGNALRANRLGSVGQALPGVEVMIDRKAADDAGGEILTRGPHVMQGYYKRDDLTSEVVDKQGWFHTGDIGHLDDDGFLFITGRIKNLIVLGGGKKIFPEEVESVLNVAPGIKELCVVGRKSADGFKEGTEEVCAVVVPADSLIHDNKDHPEVVKETIKKQFDQLGDNLAPYKRPTRILIYPEDMPKTATRKIKRPLILEWANQQKS